MKAARLRPELLKPEHLHPWWTSLQSCQDHRRLEPPPPPPLLLLLLRRTDKLLSTELPKLLPFGGAAAEKTSKNHSPQSCQDRRPELRLLLLFRTTITNSTYRCTYQTEP